MGMDLTLSVEIENGDFPHWCCDEAVGGESCRPGRLFRDAVFQALPSQRGEYKGKDCLGSEYSFSKYEALQVICAFYGNLRNVPLYDSVQDIFDLQSSVNAITMLANWAFDEADGRLCCFQ